MSKLNLQTSQKLLQTDPSENLQLNGLI